MKKANKYGQHDVIMATADMTQHSEHLLGRILHKYNADAASDGPNSTCRDGRWHKQYIGASDCSLPKGQKAQKHVSKLLVPK